MPELVYLLCLVTSVLCATLLVRSYWRTRTRLLLWSSLCFVCLAGNNALLFFDLVVTGPSIDLSPYRSLAALLGIGLLVYGLVAEPKP